MKTRVLTALHTAFAFIAVTVPAMAGIAPSPIPEPATVLLVGGGVAALILVARRRKK